MSDGEQVVALSLEWIPASASSIGSSSEGRAPTFTESAPDSERSASRASSAEGLLQSSGSEEGMFSISHAEVVSLRVTTLNRALLMFQDGHDFDYRHICSLFIPNDLEPVGRPFSADEYGLQPFILPILACSGDERPSRYLFSIVEKFYFWNPVSSELHYVTQSYIGLKEYCSVFTNIQCISIKTLEPLSRWYSQHQITHNPLWFWQHS